MSDAASAAAGVTIIGVVTVAIKYFIDRMFRRENGNGNGNGGGNSYRSNRVSLTCADCVRNTDVLMQKIEEFRNESRDRHDELKSEMNDLKGRMIAVETRLEYEPPRHRKERD